MLSEVISSIKPLLYISNLTGILVFKIDTRTATVITTKWNRLIIGITILIEIIGTCYYPYSELMDEMFFTKTSKLSSVVLVYLDHIMCVTSIFWIFMKREKFLKILVNLSEIDEQLEKSGLKMDYKGRQRKLNIVFSLLFCIVFSILVFSTSHHLWQGMNLSILTLIYNLIVFINATALTLHFIIIMHNIGTRFEMLSNCIKNSAQELPKIHLKISECVKIFNSIYGPPLMITFGNLFIWSCISLSLIVLVPKSKIELITEFCISLALTVITLFVITRVAEKMSNAKHQAIQSLYQKMLEESENSEKIFQFIMQIRHTNAAFSCIFFEFNWRLIFKFITACVMYLIIIIQFEESMKKN
ncbi:unnamed protein product [Chironomus riparius]|uniref:Gustatory receptor n=1 Tax=Chironomus riparius TaxID=315576 RepID=A0A9N9RUX9_9DIPT|nr:unnamed protein product [Chironomus riparius]